MITISAIAGGVLLAIELGNYVMDKLILPLAGDAYSKKGAQAKTVTISDEDCEHLRNNPDVGDIFRAAEEREKHRQAGHFNEEEATTNAHHHH